MTSPLISGESHESHELAYLETLLGDEHDWRLAPILTWILAEGRLIRKPSVFVRQLCRKLNDAGAPIWRFGIDVRTIHPRFAFWELTWEREAGRANEKTASDGAWNQVEYVGAVAQLVRDTHEIFRCRLDQLNKDIDHPSLGFLAARGGRDLIALPLVFSDSQTNVLVLATDSNAGYSDLDLAKFITLSTVLASSIEIHAAQRTALALLDTYVGPRAGRQVLKGQVRRGEGQKIEAAIWLSDVREFTALSESLPGANLLEMLNAYFEFINAAVTAHGGEILLFIGDAVLVVFPAAPRGGRCQACKAALDAAVDATYGIATVNMRRARAGEPEINFGIGLDVGEVIYGNVGAPDRLNFTVMGPAVNRAARLQDMTKVLGRPVLASADFTACLDAPAETLGYHSVRGVRKPQEIFVPDGF